MRPPLNHKVHSTKNKLVGSRLHEYQGVKQQPEETSFRAELGRNVFKPRCSILCGLQASWCTSSCKVLLPIRPGKVHTV